MSTHCIDEELVPAASVLPRFDRSDVAEARRVYAERVGAAPRIDPEAEGVTVEEHSVSAGDGHVVALRVYRPHRPATHGAIYHVHGGGFMLGDLRMSHPRNIEIAREVGAVVVAVDYRLAPEWPFPTPLEDVYAGLVWLHAHADDLHVDRDRIVIHGVSAGGGLAVGAALLSRHRCGPAIHFQFIASPVLDDRLTSDSSVRYTDTPALTRRDLEVCWALYLAPQRSGTSRISPFAAPARASDVSGLPPAYISVAEFDPLRDDGLDYARALLAAAVPVEVHLFPGTYHGSSALREPAISRRERAEEVAVLSAVLAKGPEASAARGGRAEAAAHV